MDEGVMLRVTKYMTSAAMTNTERATTMKTVASSAIYWSSEAALADTKIRQTFSPSSSTGTPTVTSRLE